MAGGTRHGDAHRGAGSTDACVLAGGQLSFCGANLFEGESAAGAAAYFRRHQAPLTWALGNYFGFELYLYPFEPGDQRTRFEHDVHHWAGAWWPGDCGAHLSGRVVHGDLPAYRTERRRDQAVIPA